MSTVLEDSYDENNISYEIVRFCTSEHHAKNTNGDKLRIQIRIREDYETCRVTFDRVAWEKFKKTIDDGFAELPHEKNVNLSQIDCHILSNKVVIPVDKICALMLTKDDVEKLYTELGGKVAESY